MKHHDSTLLAIFGAVMLCAGLGLAGLLQPPRAFASTADSGSGVVAVTGLASSSQEVLYLFDADTRRLAVYKVDASNRLELLAVRDTAFDLKPQEFGKNEPGVDEMKKAWKDHEKTLTGKNPD